MFGNGLTVFIKFIKILMSLEVTLIHVPLLPLYFKLPGEERKNVAVQLLSSLMFQILHVWSSLTEARNCPSGS